jgi:hypothetical protein
MQCIGFDKQSAVCAHVVLCLFSNERRIETLKNEYEARAPEREAKENGGVSVTAFEDVKEKHSKELEEIKVCESSVLLRFYESCIYTATNFIYTG